MNAFVRQLAVLSVLWSLCELLLPAGRQQHMVRVTVSVLVMTALLGTAGRLLAGGAELPAWSVQVEQTGTASYQRAALSAAANQLENWCVRMAQRAGYQAQAAVWLRENGALEKIRLILDSPSAPLMQPQPLCDAIAQALGTQRERIQLSEGT